ncbi:MAG: tRNA uridine(34) 5-carboxymethylaminomethyl modification radical SAM/GNAT enzyme Elp3 [bacterium]|nr:tRNA uridine(34) 5-carboxymethylaminomethyl modification radical SAM/GNAT enzyme Elp3 [bacterium]
MKYPNPVAVSILKELTGAHNPSAPLLHTLKRRHSKTSGQKLVTNTDLIGHYNHLVHTGEIQEDKKIEHILRVRSTRSDSGVAIVTLLTMPYPCPGKCIYCPDEERMPKSYIATEPAAARALMLQFDPYLQTRKRIEALETNGHAADKIELIFKGGTWSSYPFDYLQWFVYECFLAMNEVGVLDREIKNTNPDNPYNRFWGDEKKNWNVQRLSNEQTKNETSAHRCIGLTIETRPDFVSIQEMKRLRMLGCTRVELGVQTTDDTVLDLIKRGHSRASAAKATKLLKDVGFKVDHHLMPGLPGATPESDLESARDDFYSEDLQPDTIKLYPCVVTPNTELETWWEEGKYIPYSTDTLVDLLAKIKSIVPPHVRIARVIRDIPSTEITAGNKVTNLRENILTHMRRTGMRCRCIRCREVSHNIFLDKKHAHTIEPKLFIHRYEASGGVEYFLSFEDEKQEILFAFLRLRLPSQDIQKLFEHFPELTNAAIIRELHTYGSLVAIDTQEETAAQHKGLGKKLLLAAEEIAMKEGYEKMAVISGIGVREYYKKQGYHLEGTYMVKTLG